MKSSTLLSAFALAILPSPALAYVGPGAGLSAIGTLIALILVVFLLIGGFVWFPLKRFLKKRAKKSD